MHRTLRTIAATSLILVSLPHGNALAQQGDVAFRDDLFERGKRLTRAGKLDDAITAYEALWAIERSARVACNLGQIYFTKKEAFLKAAELLDGCRELAGELKPKQSALVEQAMARVIKVELKVTPSEHNVAIDGSGQAHKPAYYLEPGMHELLISAPGYVEQTVLIDAPGGTTERRSVELERRPDALPPDTPGKATPEPPSEASAQGASAPAPAKDDPYLARNIVVVVGGVLAVGSVGLSFMFRAQGNSKLEELDGLDLSPGDCSGAAPSPSCARADSLSSDADAAATRSDVFLGVGVGLGVATIATYLLWPDATPSRTSARGLRLVASPGRSFISYLGEF